MAASLPNGSPEVIRATQVIRRPDRGASRKKSALDVHVSIAGGHGKIALRLTCLLVSAETTWSVWFATRLMLPMS